MLDRSKYIAVALALAEYTQDEDGVVIASVPGTSGYFAQGYTREEAQANLCDVIEGNLLLASQLGLPIPQLPGADLTNHT